MQTEKSQTEGKRILPETRFIELSEFYVDPMVGIFRSASESNVLSFFLIMTIKILNDHSLILLYLTFYVA